MFLKFHAKRQNSAKSDQSSVAIATHANGSGDNNNNWRKISADSSRLQSAEELQNVAADKTKTKNPMTTTTSTKLNDENILNAGNLATGELSATTSNEDDSGSEGLLVLEAANDLADQDLSENNAIATGIGVRESNWPTEPNQQQQRELGEESWRKIVWPSSLLVNNNKYSMTNDDSDGQITKPNNHNDYDNKSSVQVGQNHHLDHYESNSHEMMMNQTAVMNEQRQQQQPATTSANSKTSANQIGDNGRKKSNTRNQVPNNNNYHEYNQEFDQITAKNSWFSHSNSFKFVQFFHSQMVAPAESLASCYMSSGEHYAGNVSRSRDNRPCLNWLQVSRLLLSLVSNPEQNSNNNETINNEDANLLSNLMMQLQSDELLSLNHNHCRNYDSNPRGPWCYVQYSDSLDNQSDQKLQQQQSPTDSLGNVVYLIAKQCNIEPCSRYLWLYIVAPPVSLLTIFMIIVIFSLKSMRKRRSYYKKCIRSMGKAVLPTRFHKISIVSYGANDSRHHHKITNKSKQSQLNVGTKIDHAHKQYVVEDDENNLFCCADDIQWAQECLPIENPKTGDSMKLDYYMPFDSTSKLELIRNSSKNNSKSNGTNQRPIDCENGKNKKNSIQGNYQRSKSHLQFQQRVTAKTNQFGLSKPSPYSTEKLLDLSTSSSVMTTTTTATTNTQRTTDFTSTTSGSECSSSSQTSSPRVCQQQNGPIFATLRCHLRKSLATSSSNSNIKSQVNANSVQKSNSGASHYATTRRPDRNKNINKRNQVQQQLQCNGNSFEQNKLISCSTTLDDIEPICLDEDHHPLSPNNVVKAIQLPHIDSTSVTIISNNNNNEQLLFEGKFSHVSKGTWKQRRDGIPNDISNTNSTNHNNDEDEYCEILNPIAASDIGLEIAIHSLKSNHAGGALIDPAVFSPDNLTLKNLNHLNLIKLIGCMIEQPITNSSNHFDDNTREQVTCSLIYDMSQLVDFADWLKHQNNDLIIASQLDLDETSEQSIRLRRNLTCLAKQIALALDYLHDQDIVYQDLACRNCFIDPTKMLVKLATFNQEPCLRTNQQDDLSSPKLTLHTNKNINNAGEISENEKYQALKSMIRPKYLLDYYVIDSRPSGSQLQPLSWIPLESILFNKFNKQTDIWSYGCLLYEIFSLGEVAYFGYSCKQIIDSIRSNLMPPQPSLCPNGIYRLMCNCLSDIPTIRPNIKQIYEQLNLFSGQCSSFLDHHLCSLNTASSKMDHINNKNPVKNRQ